MDTLLSLDLGSRDCLYRIRRCSPEAGRVIYVTTDLAVIPEQIRTDGPAVIAELRKLQEWSDTWTTLRVHKDDKGLWCEIDAFPPHALSKQYIIDAYPTRNLFDLKHLRSLNHRVSEVLLDGQTCFLKIARFAHELSYLAREVRAYLHLKGSHQVPKFLGYVFEDKPERVVGILLESVYGRVADISDLKDCYNALRDLHVRIIHGDLCRHNIMITSEGPKFIDLEESLVLDDTLRQDAWENLIDAELQSLPGKLTDESGTGRPWGVD